MWIDKRLSGGEAPFIYFDYNAMAPIRPHVRDYARDLLLKDWGNPSSVHKVGRFSRSLVEGARSHLADLVQTSASHVIFTSGATEANNWTICQFDRVVVSHTEHDSVLKSVKVPLVTHVDSNGIVDLSCLEKILSENNDDPLLVSICLAHNETGVVQPLDEIIHLIQRFPMTFLHVDAVQAFLRVPFCTKGIDYLTLSSHKIGGLTGVGALVRSARAPLSPLVKGGGQEFSLRSGTENIIAIACFKEALKDAKRDDWRCASLIRDALEKKLVHNDPSVHFVGQKVKRLPNTTLFITPGFTSESQVIFFDLHNIGISSGSACSSGKVRLSSTLRALGIDEKGQKGAIRLSFSPTVLQKDVDTFLNVFKNRIHHREVT